jgi:hypothetical protein
VPLLVEGLEEPRELVAVEGQAQGVLRQELAESLDRDVIDQVAPGRRQGHALEFGHEAGILEQVVVAGVPQGLLGEPLLGGILLGVGD